MQPSNRVFGQMSGLIREFNTAGLRAANAAALEAKRIHLTEIRRAAGGDLRLSKVGTRGAALNVRYRAATSEANPVAIVQAVGPLHLLENPIKPHTMRARPRRGKRGVLSTPYGPRAQVQHPGVNRPKRPWAKGRVLAHPAIERTIRRQYGSAVARGMR